MLIPSLERNILFPNFPEIFLSEQEKDQSLFSCPDKTLLFANTILTDFNDP